MVRRLAATLLLCLAATLCGRGLLSAEAPDPDQMIRDRVAIEASTGSVTGGQLAHFTVRLGGTAEVDREVVISTDQPALFTDLPGSVVVPAGDLSVGFAATTTTVSANTNVAVYATGEVNQSTAEVTVIP